MFHPDWIWSPDYPHGLNRCTQARTSAAVVALLPVFLVIPEEPESLAPPSFFWQESVALLANPGGALIAPNASARWLSTPGEIPNTLSFQVA